MARNTDLDWQHYGTTNPFYGVLSHAEFDVKNLNKQAIEKFYETGREHIERVIARAAEVLNAPNQHRLALDFGCGVGRLLLPLAKYADQVIGVDISTAMLAKARERAATEDIQNVEFIVSDDELSRLTTSPDFIHSYIVLQHIPVERGMKIIAALLSRLAPGGYGALHVTFGMTGHSGLDNAVVRRNRHKRHVKKFLNVLPNFVRKPYMQMNDYSMNDILQSLYSAKCESVHLDFIVHDGHLGAMCFFKKGLS